MKEQEFSEFYETLEKKLNREEGLCTSIRNNDTENFSIMLFIGNAYISGVELEKRDRLSGIWRSVNSLPTDFNFVYRKRDNSHYDKDGHG